MAKKTKTKETTTEDLPYDVAYLAEELDIDPFTVRVKLRKAGIEKAGRKYGWKTKKAADEVLETLREQTGKRGRKKSKIKSDEKKGKKKGSKKSKKPKKDNDEDLEED